MKKLFILALALALTISLAACGGNSSGNPPASTAGNGTSGDASSTSAPTTTSSDAGNGGLGISTSWPSDWPSEVPKIDGTVNTSSSASGIFNVEVAVSGQSVCDSYFSLLASKGYTKTIDMDVSAGQHMYQYVSDKYTVTGAYDDGQKIVTMLLTPQAD